MLEWECCLKNGEDGAREGSRFIKDHIINVSSRAFDDFAETGNDSSGIKKMLGII